MKRSVVIIFFMGILLLGVRWCLIAVHMDTPFCVEYDPSFSSISQSLLYDQLIIAAQKKKSLPLVIADLKKAYPYIKDISIVYRPVDIKIKITSYVPECIVNEASIFVDAGYLLDRSLFAEQELAYLPSFLLSQDVISDSLNIIPQLLDQIPTHVHNEYTVEVKNKHTIVFSHKKDDHFSILASIEGPLPPDIFNQCAMVKNDINKNELKNKSATWVADARFAHYIVAYKA